MSCNLISFYVISLFIHSFIQFIRSVQFSSVQFSSVQFSSFHSFIQFNSISLQFTIYIHSVIHWFISVRSFLLKHFNALFVIISCPFMYSYVFICIHPFIHTFPSFLPSFFPSFMYSLCIIFASHRIHLHWHLNNHFKSLLMQLTNIRIGHWCLILIALVQNFCPGTAWHFCYSNYEYDSFILMGRSDFSKAIPFGIDKPCTGLREWTLGVAKKHLCQHTHQPRWKGLVFH